MTPKNEARRALRSFVDIDMHPDFATELTRAEVAILRMYREAREKVSEVREQQPNDLHAVNAALRELAYARVIRRLFYTAYDAYCHWRELTQDAKAPPEDLILAYREALYSFYSLLHSLTYDMEGLR